MILGFDTETSGLWRNDLDTLDRAQPHLAQLAAKLFDDHRTVVASLTVKIQPDGWSIEPGAAEVNHLSDIRCRLEGVNLVSALTIFADLVSRADRIVGFNLHGGVDRRIIAASINRVGAQGLWWSRKASAMFCVMEAATPVCQIPGEFGFKFPSLDEAHAILCPLITRGRRHDAEADLDDMMAVYWALVDAGHVKEIDPWQR